METSKEETKNKKNICPFSLKPMKNNENKEKRYFCKLTDVLMSFNLFPFFRIHEAKELGKIDTKFYNSFVRYYERGKDWLIKKYNIKIENEKEYDPNGIYEQKDDQGHFIKLNFFNLEHYLLFSYHNWTWRDTNQYWEKITPKNSLLNKDIYRLKTVCWVDVNAHMSHIFHGKYKLYLNHCVCNLAENMLKMTVSLDGVPLQEFIYPSREQVNKCRDAHKDEEDKKEEDVKEGEKKEGKNENNEEKAILDGPRAVRVGLRRGPFLRIRNPRTNINIKTYNKDNSLNKEFIMDINIPYDKDLDNSNGHVIKVQFDHTEGSWKNNWLIDGVILEEIH